MGTDVIGTTVNVAARLVAAAAPREVLVSEEAARLAAGPTIRFGPGRTLALKGLSTTMVGRPLVSSSSCPRAPAELALVARHHDRRAAPLTDQLVTGMSRHLPVSVRSWIGAR
jgi:hypothetical protein